MLSFSTIPKDEKGRWDTSRELLQDRKKSVCPRVVNLVLADRVPLQILMQSQSLLGDLALLALCLLYFTGLL